MALGTKRKATQRLSVNPVSLPSGAVQEFAGSTAPEGWLMCDGSAVSRTDYAALYSVIGDTYGAGDGVDTFNLPDLRGEFVRGLDDMGTAQGARGVDSGRGLGSTQSHSTNADDLSNSTSSVTGSAATTTNLTGSFRDPTTFQNDWITSGKFTHVDNQGNFDFTGHTATTRQTARVDLNVNHSHNVSGTAAAQTISGAAETRPRNCAMNFIIKL